MRLVIRVLAPLVLLLTMLLPATGATAAPAVIQRDKEITTDVNACNGETILVHAKFQFVTIALNNGQAIQHLSYHGTGIGDQGNEYVLNVSEHVRTSESELIQRRVLVSKGSAPNQHILIILVGDDVFIESDCRG